MNKQEQIRQQEALRFCRWWSHHPDERELIQKILQEDCVEADLAQALGIVRNRQFYFLLPFLLRPPYIDRATENQLEKLFIGLLLEQFQDHPIGEWCAALQKEILQTTA